METTAILSNTLESWRRGAVRRFLSGPNGAADADPTPRSRAAARETNWGDTFWETRGSAKALPRRRPVHWFEQIELWDKPAAPVEIAPVATRMEFEDDVPAYYSEPRHETQPVAVTKGPAHIFGLKQRSVRMADIAKFLQVNRAVDGLDENAHRFSLPQRFFAARFNLWKGSPVGTPFLTGC